MKAIRNKKIIQRKCIIDSTKEKPYIDETKEDTIMITYKYNKDTKRYEFFNTNGTKIKNKFAEEKLEAVRSILCKNNKTKENKIKENKINTQVKREKTFEEEYAEFIAKLKADQETEIQKTELIISSEMEEV